MMRYLRSVKFAVYQSRPGGLGFCPFYGGGSVVFDLLFYVPHIVCLGSVFGPYFVKHVLSSFAIIKTRIR